MKLTLQSQDLVRELSLAQGAVDRKNTVPMLQNVLLTARAAGENETLELTTTNLEVGFHASCRAEVEEPGTIAVPMRRLYDYIRLLPGRPVAISTTAADAVMISCGSANTRIGGMESRNYPSLSQISAEPIDLPVEPLVNAIKRTIISVAGEQSHYSLAGALLVVRPDAIGVVSTDGHRLSVYFEELESTGATEPMQGLIPRKAMAELQRILEEAEGTEEEPAQVRFAMDEKNMRFESGGRVFVAQKMTGKFPDYRRVLPKDLGITLYLSNEKLSRVLRRVSQFSDPRSHAVKLELIDGMLKIDAALSQAGSSEESVLVDYTGEKVSVGFNAQYIIEFLSVCNSEEVLMRLRDSRSAAQFEVPGMPSSTDYCYVVMPIRV